MRDLGDDPAGRSPFFTWRVIAAPNLTVPLPEFIHCLASPIAFSEIAPEVSLMLPNRNSNSDLMQILDRKDTSLEGHGVGLFLSDPFLQVDQMATLLRQNRVRAVLNFPSVDQQDSEFTDLLSDVGLDSSLEHRNLSAFADRGLEIGVLANTKTGGAAAAKLKPSFLLTVPKVPDFAAGFPSMRQRGALVQAVRHGAQEANWTGPILTLGDKTEADHMSLWADGVSGVITFT